MDTINGGAKKKTDNQKEMEALAEITIGLIKAAKEFGVKTLTVGPISFMMTEVLKTGPIEYKPPVIGQVSEEVMLQAAKLLDEEDPDGIKNDLLFFSAE